jgi:hypothetical protein
VQIYTVNIGIAYGQSAMLLAAGTPGCRFALEHSSTMLLQPRMPPTGARQAIEVQIAWREVHAMYKQHLRILSRHTGNSEEKLDYDMQRCALGFSLCTIFFHGCTSTNRLLQACSSPSICGAHSDICARRHAA